MTTASALLLGVALVTGGAMAASEIAGNKGGAVTVDRAAPTPIPAFTPSPTPTVDASSVSRGPLSLDPAAALESMGTVTLSSDGKVSEQPASEGLRAILETEIAGSNPEMATDRAVIGADDRVQITDSTVYPAPAIGLLITKNQKGEYGACSATLIGPYSVITAAHCVYDNANGGWIADLVFVPGAVDAENAPFGTFKFENINILKGFIDNYQDSYGDVMPWDLAEIELTEPAGDQVGWLGVRIDEGSDFAATMVGYPGDKPTGTMWTVSCDIPSKFFGEQNYLHGCDSYPGSSGSSMFEVVDGNYVIRGINVAEDNAQVPADERMNYGVRLIDSYFQFIVDYYK